MLHLRSSGRWHLYAAMAAATFLVAALLPQVAYGEFHDVWFKCPNGGCKWGTWRTFVQCPAGSYVGAARVRTDWTQPTFGDATGVNSIEMSCYNKVDPVTRGNYVATILSDPGIWGSWADWVHCKGFITAVRLWVDKPRFTGSGDDVSVIRAEFWCSEGKALLPPKLFHTGKADAAWVECKAGHAVCGFNVKIEGRVTGDDTALNKIMIKCCPF